MEGVMSNYPDGIAIICANNDDMAVAAARAAKNNPAYDNTVFLGFDGQISAAQAILDGELSMTTAQNPYDMAYKAVEAMVQYLNGEEVEEIIDSGYTIVTAETAREHIDKLKSYSEK
jgi:ribose transport system substrate-binding protein